MAIEMGELGGGEEASFERKDFMRLMEKTPEFLRSCCSSSQSMSMLVLDSRKLVGRRVSHVLKSSAVSTSFEGSIFLSFVETTGMRTSPKLSHRGQRKKGR